MSAILSMVSAPRDGTPILALNDDLSYIEVIRWWETPSQNVPKDGEPRWMVIDWGECDFEPVGWLPIAQELLELILRKYPA